MSKGQYALLGAPVIGSKSPLIHQTSFKYNDIEATYEAFEVLPENLGEALEAFIQKGYNGFNITIPHKETIITYLDELDPLAERMGAVNTVVVKNGFKKGYNTDGLGFLASLKSHHIPLEGLKILVLGAGGAAKGIVHALAMEGVSTIDLYNRTVEKAEELSKILRQTYSLESNVLSEEDIQGQNMENYHVVINATSIGMLPHTEQVPIAPEHFNPNTIFCDIVYKPHETLFLRRAREMGAKCIYGIEMLIFQALLSEEIWEDCKIDLIGTKNILFEAEGLFK